MIKKILLVILVMTLLGCATNADRQFMLNQSLMSYEKTYRWGEFANLLHFRKAPTSDDMNLVSGYEGIRISGYRVKRTVPTEDTRKFAFDVEISYFRTNDNRIQTVIDQQTWEYDDDSKRWLITSPLPVFN